MDTFSFGAVLYEIAVRNVPYGDEIAELKKQKRGGGAKKLMREVATGARRPELAGVKGLRNFHVGSVFKKRGLLMRDVCSDQNCAQALSLVRSHLCSEMAYGQRATWCSKMPLKSHLARENAYRRCFRRAGVARCR